MLVQPRWRDKVTKVMSHCLCLCGSTAGDPWRNKGHDMIKAVVKALQAALDQQAAPSLSQILTANAADQRGALMAGQETLMAGQKALFEGQQALSQVHPPQRTARDTL